jgi:hypothetical protein
MQYALPHPRQSIVVPLVTLALGAAGGATAAAILSDDDVIHVQSPAPAVASQTLSATPKPVDQAVHPGKLGARVGGDAVAFEPASSGTTSRDHNSFGARQ